MRTGSDSDFLFNGYGTLSFLLPPMPCGLFRMVLDVAYMAAGGGRLRPRERGQSWSQRGFDPQLLQGADHVEEATSTTSDRYEPVAGQGDILLYRRAGESGALIIDLGAEPVSISSSSIGASVKFCCQRSWIGTVSESKARSICAPT
jgi:hypothetical protein